MSRAYEGATRSNRTVTFIAPSSGPNVTLNGALNTLRNRSRALVRNTPLVARAINSLVTNEIGTGIQPRAQMIGQMEQVNDLFRDTQEFVDADGVFDFYGLQGLAKVTQRIAGECFIRRRRRSRNSMDVPVQFQVLEPEYVPETKTESLPNGNRIIAGIEFNRRGQRVAYHMYAEHPTDENAWRNGARLLRISARDVIHCFRPRRPGQVRGEPDAVRALLKVHTFDTYDDSELVRKQTRSQFTGFLEQGAIPPEDSWKFNPITGEEMTGATPDDPPESVLASGTILTGVWGEKLTLFSGDDSGEGYEDFMRMQMMMIAAGLDIPYELMSGDWRNVNDRLVRQVLGEYRRTIEMERRHFVHGTCRPLYGWWLNAAVSVDALTLPNFTERQREYARVQWVPQAWPYVNPEQDVKADAAEVEAGFASRDQKIIGRGGNPAEVDAQQAAGDRRRSAAGVSDDEE